MKVEKHYKRQVLDMSTLLQIWNIMRDKCWIWVHFYKYETLWETIVGYEYTFTNMKHYERQVLDMSTLLQTWNIMRDECWIWVHFYKYEAVILCHVLYSCEAYFFVSRYFTCTYFLWQNEVGAALAEAGEYILQVFSMYFIKFGPHAIKN